MEITSVVVHDWSTARDYMPFRVIQSHEFDLFINYDKQILIVTPLVPNGQREIIPLSRVFSIHETTEER